ncbi:MAG: AsmA family protein [Candidatus Eisenbacteria bacterium]|nr:AsmA family protein [Candidatus Eisenbacteria bacterium]
MLLGADSRPQRRATHAAPYRYVVASCYDASRASSEADREEGPMPRTGRPLLTILLIALALLVIVVLVLPLLIPKQQVRDWIVARAERELERPVAVGSVGAGLLPRPWVRLGEIELGEAPGQPASRITAESVTLRLSLLPLLQRRAEVTSILIERPHFEMTLPGELPAGGAAGDDAPGQGAGSASADHRASGAFAEAAPAGEGIPLIGSGDGAAAGEGAGEGAAEGGRAAVSSPVEIEIHELQIRDGSLAILHPGGKPFLEIGRLEERLSAQFSRQAVIALEGQTEIDELQLHLPAGALGHGLQVRLTKRLSLDTNADRLEIEQATLALGELPVEVQGAVAGLSAGAPIADLHLSGGPARVEEIMAYVPASLLAGTEDVRSSGTLELSARIEGALVPPEPSREGQKELLPPADFTVDFSLAEGRIEHPELPAALEGLAIEVHATPDTLHLPSIALRSGTSRLHADAIVSDYIAAPRFRGALDAQIDLALFDGVESLQLSGSASAKLTASGPLDRPGEVRADGTVRLQDLNASGPELPLPIADLNADLTLRGEKLRIRQLAGRIGASDLRLTGEVAGYRALDPAVWTTAADGGESALEPARIDLEPARIDLELHSEHLDLDALMLQPPGGEGAPSGGRDARDAGDHGSGGDASEPIPPTAALGVIEGRITAEVGELVLNRARARDVKARLRLDRGRIFLESAGGLAFGGTVAAEGEIDFRDAANPRFDVQTHVHQVEARKLYDYAAGLSRFGRLGGFLSGRIDASAKMSGALDDSLALELGSLDSEGRLETQDAELGGHPLQQSLSSYLSVPQLERLEISDWIQPFRIQNGRLTIDGMQLRAGEIELSGSGWQAIDGSVGLEFELLLPPELSERIRGKVPAELQPVLFEPGEGERVLVPLEVTGRLPKPKVGLDEARLRATLRQRATELLEEERDDLEQKLRDRLEGLFKR